MDGARFCTPLAVHRGSRRSRHLQLCLDPNNLFQVLCACKAATCDVKYNLSPGLPFYKPASQLALEVVCGLGSTSWLSRGDSGECSEEDWEVGLQLVWTDVFMAAFAYGGRSRQFPFSLALTIPQSRLPVI